ncbi:ABC transporter permease [bacterium]|jgi:ABC-type polysaccharide/polyol phosphate export permease|nr:ABC transporter permease [bacterium]
MGQKRIIAKLKKIFQLGFYLGLATFKTRTEGTSVGILWYLLEPLLFFIILMSIRGAFNVNLVHYPLYLFLGIIMFNLFSKSTRASINVMFANSGVIKSIKVSYFSLVIAVILNVVFAHLFEILVFMILMIYYGIPFFRIFLYIPVFFFYLIFIFGCSMILSLLGIFIRDFVNIWGVVLRALWFATPIFWVAKRRFFLSVINPLFYFLTMARDVTINGVIPSYRVIFVVIIASILSLLVGLFVFNRFEKKIPEML